MVNPFTRKNSTPCTEIGVLAIAFLCCVRDLAHHTSPRENGGVKVRSRSTASLKRFSDIAPVAMVVGRRPMVSELYSTSSFHRYCR